MTRRAMSEADRQRVAGQAAIRTIARGERPVCRAMQDEDGRWYVLGYPWLFDRRERPSVGARGDPDRCRGVARRPSQGIRRRVGMKVRGCPVLQDVALGGRQSGTGRQSSVRRVANEAPRPTVDLPQDRIESRTRRLSGVPYMSGEKVGGGAFIGSCVRYANVSRPLQHSSAHA